MSAYTPKMGRNRIRIWPDQQLQTWIDKPTYGVHWIERTRHRRRYYSALTQTDLESTCRVNDIGQLVIVGSAHRLLVRHTTYDAFLRGIDVVVVSDATAVFEPFSEVSHEVRQEAALSDLQTFCKAEAITCDELL